MTDNGEGKRVCCIALNSEFMPGYKAMMNSILRHTDNFSEHILCLDLDLTEEDRSVCRDIYEGIEFIKPLYENYKRLPTHAPALKNAFYKLEVFRLAQNYDRLLFLDCDIVFVESIDPLLNKRTPAQFAAAYHPKFNQFNTGVMLLSRLDDKPYRGVMSLVRTMKKAWLGDQTVIHIAIGKKMFSVSRIPRRWNVTKRQVLHDNVPYAGLHFVAKKPWLGGEKGYERIEKVWHKYAKDTDG
jgi:lipopolysaccharide biosynthesis glycosyltransferase